MNPSSNVSSMRTHRDAEGRLHWSLNTASGRHSGVLQAGPACGSLQAQEQRLESGQVRLIVRQNGMVVVDLTAEAEAVAACWLDLREAARRVDASPMANHSMLSPMASSSEPATASVPTPSRGRRIRSMLVVILASVLLTLALMIGIGMVLNPDGSSPETRIQPQGEFLWQPPER